CEVFWVASARVRGPALVICDLFPSGDRVGVTLVTWPKPLHSYYASQRSPKAPKRQGFDTSSAIGRGRGTQGPLGRERSFRHEVTEIFGGRRRGIARPRSGV